MAKADSSTAQAEQQKPFIDTMQSVNGSVQKGRKDQPISIAALKIHFPGRFGQDEIPSDKTRVPLNSACRALSGITAIAKILYANEVERNAQGEEAEVLDVTTAYGLFEALIFLAEHGDSSATDLGGALFREAMKGGA